MYGDTDAIRRLAARLQDHAAQVRHEADRLASAADAVPWQGLAAQAMRLGVADRAEALRRCAHRHEDAAEALIRHAHCVDQIKRLIAWIEHRVRSLIASARQRIAGLLAEVIDPLDDLLDRFVPPPSGHRDWLMVRLPGLQVPTLDDLPNLGAA